MDKICKSLSSNTYVKPKDRKRSLYRKNDHNAFWLFLNNRNALWHVKIRHDAKVELWLLKEMTTTSSDFMKIPQGVVVVTFYNHDVM